MNARRARRAHHLAAQLRQAGLEPPAKARRLDRWLQAYTPGRARPARRSARLRSGRPLPTMPREPWTLPGRGPAKVVGRHGPSVPGGRIRRADVLADRRSARRLARLLWRQRRARRRDREAA